MSTIDDFNRIDDCDKIDAKCIDAFAEFDFNKDSNTGICLDTSWGSNCLDLTEIVKNAESCTTLYLSPDENPNCLVYEKEEKCGDNDCIDGDDLSRIISMQKLKDVSQTLEIANGNVYMYNSETEMFEPFDLATVIGNLNTAITNLAATFNNLNNRITRLEEILTPPSDLPEGAKVSWGNINLYSDHNAVIDANGNVVSLDKTHGLYTHNLSDNAQEDEIMG